MTEFPYLGESPFKSKTVVLNPPNWILIYIFSWEINKVSFMSFGTWANNPQHKLFVK